MTLIPPPPPQMPHLSRNFKCNTHRHRHRHRHRHTHTHTHTRLSRSLALTRSYFWNAIKPLTAVVGEILTDSQQPYNLTWFISTHITIRTMTKYTEKTTTTTTTITTKPKTKQNNNKEKEKKKKRKKKKSANRHSRLESALSLAWACGGPRSIS